MRPRAWNRDRTFFFCNRSANPELIKRRFFLSCLLGATQLASANTALRCIFMHQTLFLDRGAVLITITADDEINFTQFALLISGSIFLCAFHACGSICSRNKWSERAPKITPSANSKKYHWETQFFWAKRSKKALVHEL